MAYNIDNFVKLGERNLQIIDSSGTAKYSINPYQILNILQNNNLLKINLKSGKLITLDFQSSTEALQSVLTLQGIIDELVTITPFTIDKAVENWVEDIHSISPTNEVLAIFGDLLPGTTSTYNIGSPDYEWHTLYVGSQSLVIGGVTISSADGSIILNSLNLDETLVVQQSNTGSSYVAEFRGNGGAQFKIGVSSDNNFGVANDILNSTNTGYSNYNLNAKQISFGINDDPVVGPGLPESLKIENSGLVTVNYGLEVNDVSSFNGQVTLQQTLEIINTINVTSSTTFDFSYGSIWYVDSINTDFTANFINVPVTNNRVITTKIIIPQSATAYIPTSVEIDGVTQSIKWLSGTAFGTPNNLDIVVFTFLRTSSSWSQIFGQINYFV